MGQMKNLAFNCTHVTTLHSCYMKNAFFSVNQKHNVWRGNLMHWEKTLNCPIIPKVVGRKGKLFQTPPDCFNCYDPVLFCYFCVQQPEWKLADPICTFLFSLLVLLTTLNILKETIHVLMEGKQILSKLSLLLIKIK